MRGSAPGRRPTTAAGIEPAACHVRATPRALRVQEEGHPYWDIRNPPGMVDRYSHVVNARMHAMRRNLDVWGRLTHTLTLTLTLTLTVILTLTLTLTLTQLGRTSRSRRTSAANPDPSRHSRAAQPSECRRTA